MSPTIQFTDATHGQTVTDPNAPTDPGTAKAQYPGVNGVNGHVPPQSEFDYLVVGGGTSGSVIAARLSEDPDISVAVIEGGPTDVGLERVLNLQNWINLLGSDLDYDYPTVEQPRGNSHIRHSRARVLGGCSSHNTLISFRPFAEDLDSWAQLGAKGWDSHTLQPYGSRLLLQTAPVHLKDRNTTAKAWVESCSKALGVPVIQDFNAAIAYNGGLPNGGVGFFPVSYDPHNMRRSSASVAYLHPIMDKRNNLKFFFETWAYGLVFDEKDPIKVIGVKVKSGQNGEEKVIKAKKEVIVCAGAFDSPKLLMLSGIGPKSELEQLGIKSVIDLPGVGENLQDHPESIIMWRARSSPKETVMTSDAGLFVRTDKSNPDPRPNLMFHIYQIPFTDNTERHGYEKPEHAVCMTPNIPRSRARGKVSLASSNPLDKPLLNFRYFMDSEDYDSKILVEGIKLARKIAKTAPFSSLIEDEIAPGPNVQTDEEIDEYARKVHHTVYHPSCTTKIGGDDDPMAVLDERCRVRGAKGLRVVDAGVFPTLSTVNPMVTILMVAERASDLIKEDLYE
ncbi:alcohol oxidase [Dendrothele bispora CBS 962.96]|uniref:Alcohol oxidase n=1 Tax=Dendrothele bispora (strain CBS 962.96) TaxID=1314807 RepID=A0A4V4HEF9_DENBC|nr:alcohol oxidase [Dendrothele bispora CBS 962.96]